MSLDTHGARYVNNYANDIGADNYALFEEAGPAPVGTVLAKDSFTVTAGGRVGAGAALPDGEDGGRDSDPDTGDWRYTLIMPSGKVIGATGGKGAARVEFCAECHLGVEEYDSRFLPGRGIPRAIGPVAQGRVSLIAGANPAYPRTPILADRGHDQGDSRARTTRSRHRPRLRHDGGRARPPSPQMRGRARWSSRSARSATPSRKAESTSRAPTCNGVFGRTSGTAEGFKKYSKAMKEAGHRVERGDHPRLHRRPQGLHPEEHKMAFRGVKKEKDRLNLIAYLKEATGAE